MNRVTGRLRLSAAACVGACLLASSATAEAVQWRPADGGNGHWYEAVPFAGGLGWVAASSLAVQRGGYLACPTSPAESEWLSASVALMPSVWNGPTGPWLGGYQDLAGRDYSEPNGGWRWVSGEAWNWAAWDDPANPNPSNSDAGCGNERWLHLINPDCGSVPTAWWNDVGSLPCNCLPISVGFVVEYDADCNGDGVVDFGQLRSGDLLDVNGDSIPDACQCLGDISGDGVVNGVDLAFVLSLWGTSGGGTGASDVTGDGVVDGMDLSVVLGGWGPCR
jgi:hypothetical protein